MIIPEKKDCEICHRPITILNAGPEFEKKLCACCPVILIMKSSARCRDLQKIWGK